MQRFIILLFFLRNSTMKYDLVNLNAYDTHLIKSIPHEIYALHLIKQEAGI